MGKPSLLVLLDLIETRLEDNPGLGYLTLLELIQFVKGYPQYQGYLPTLEKIQLSYQEKVIPVLITPQPMPYFKGQSVLIRMKKPPLQNLSFTFQADVKFNSKSLENSLIEIECEPMDQKSFTLTYLIDNQPIHRYMITLTSPVEMDNLGL
jgi:hypothetical protein